LSVLPDASAQRARAAESCRKAHEPPLSLRRRPARNGVERAKTTRARGIPFPSFAKTAKGRTPDGLVMIEETKAKLEYLAELQVDVKLLFGNQILLQHRAL
jgi:hypothetical protein